jgi:hypothetical protein
MQTKNGDEVRGGVEVEKREKKEYIYIYMIKRERIEREQSR